MAAIARKPTKQEVGELSATRAKRQNGESQVTRRRRHARRASSLLKNISDHTRLEIILTLAEGEQHVGALCTRLSQNQPTVSHHLALLRHGGIIVLRRQGKNNFYSLTDTGGDLAKVVHNLAAGVTKEPSAVHTGAARASSLQMRSPRAARQKLTDSPTMPEVRSENQDDNDEASLSVLNQRRAELIFKKNRDRLNEAECSELEHLQQRSLSRMQREFPGTSHVDEQLRKIEQRLRGDGPDKA